MATQPQRSRQSRALEMLQAQLKSGVKNKRVVNDDELVPLTDKDKTRIGKEIQNLKDKL
jgi:hypothetical protein